MAKGVKVLCDRCEAKLIIGRPFCGSCGTPTRWASHEERTAWELSQWQKTDKPRNTASTDDTPKASRRWPRPFTRKRDSKRPLELVEPQPERRRLPKPAVVEEPATTLEPKPQRAIEAVKPEQGATVKPIARRPAAPKPVRKIAPGPRDGEPLDNGPATVMAMRLLAARVAELDAKVQRLERELDREREKVIKLS